MAQCKYCGHKGIFLALDPNGLCKECAPRVIFDLQQRKRIMDDSMKLAQEGKTFETRLSRCDLLLEHAEALLEYETKGIRTISPAPSALLSQFRAYRDELILDEARKAAEKAATKASIATSIATKQSALGAGFMKVRSIIEKHSNPAMGQSIEDGLRTLMHKAKLDGFLDAARKADFKGDKRKAIDQYKEALYFIKTDDISDELQANELKEIESKLEELEES